MLVLKWIILIVFILDCVALTALVLAQEGKAGGLGSVTGGNTDTFWGQNKGRSKEGNLVKLTTVLAILFFVLAAVLNLKVFA